MEKNPELRPTTLLEYLQEKSPTQYQQCHLRTLQRRVSQWKATSGPPKDVMFEQSHQPGEMSLSDFTHFKQVTISIGGKPFEHLLYHYRLAYSGWPYVQAIQGGESFVALSQGLQNALVRSGGSTKLHRTDRLSAAYFDTHRTSVRRFLFHQVLSSQLEIDPDRTSPQAFCFTVCPTATNPRFLTT